MNNIDNIKKEELICQLRNFAFLRPEEDKGLVNKLVALFRSPKCTPEQIDTAFYDIKTLSETEGHNQELDNILRALYFDLKESEQKEEDENEFEKSLSKINSEALFEICEQLEQHPYIREKDLRKILGKKRSTMSNLMARAQSFELIDIRRFGRENIITLTGKGQNFVQFGEAHFECLQTTAERTIDFGVQPSIAYTVAPFCKKVSPLMKKAVSLNCLDSSKRYQVSPSSNSLKYKI